MVKTLMNTVVFEPFCHSLLSTSKTLRSATRLFLGREPSVWPRKHASTIRFPDDRYLLAQRVELKSVPGEKSGSQVWISFRNLSALSKEVGPPVVLGQDHVHQLPLKMDHLGNRSPSEDVGPLDRVNSIRPTLGHLNELRQRSSMTGKLEQGEQVDLVSKKWSNRLAGWKGIDSSDLYETKWNHRQGLPEVAPSMIAMYP